MQTATTREYDPSTGTWDGNQTLDRNIVLYPNPAGELVNVYFEQRPDEALELIIYNLSGRMVLSDRVEEEEMVKTVELNTLGNGMYILELRRVRNGSLYYRTKFVHD